MSYLDLEYQQQLFPSQLSIATFEEYLSGETFTAVYTGARYDQLYKAN